MYSRHLKNAIADLENNEEAIKSVAPECFEVVLSILKDAVLPDYERLETYEEEAITEITR